jgi:hypothetical protein
MEQDAVKQAAREAEQGRYIGAFVVKKKVLNRGYQAARLPSLASLTSY